MRLTINQIISTLCLFIALVSADYPWFCRCQYDREHYEITELKLDPQSTALPCSSCTRQFCIDEAKIDIKDPNDVFSSCFQRQSFKDLLIVYGFIILTSILLVFAGIKRFRTWRS